MKKIPLIFIFFLIIPFFVSADHNQPHSVQQLNERVQTLLQQLNQTTSSQGTQTPPPSQPVSSSPLFTKSLYPGLKDPEVVKLQQALNSAGFIVVPSGPGSPGNETDYFGPATKAAVKRFQTQQGIVNSGTPETTGYGVVGPRTRVGLNELRETPSGITPGSLSPSQPILPPPTTLPALDTAGAQPIPQPILPPPTTLPALGTAGPQPILPPPNSASPPLRRDTYCFYQKFVDDPACAKYYSGVSLVCPQYFNPVYDSSGIFYPSACWAEALGANAYTYGYSPRLLAFFADEWKKYGYTAPYPDIEFSYQGSGISGAKSGTWLRSTLWQDTQTYLSLDYDIATSFDTIGFTTPFPITTFTPVINATQNLLLVFVTFDNAYPETLLLERAALYGTLVNDYIKKKQAVPSSLQYKFSIITIPPPIGVQRITRDHIYFSSEELQLIFSAATKKVGSNIFSTFSISPVQIGGFGGYYHNWNNMHTIIAPLSPRAVYSSANIIDGINAISAIQGMFLTLSHEILHALGLSGDHLPMGYGTYFLEWTGALVTDPVTGKSKPEDKNICDFLATSPDYYSVELPLELTIQVGAEPVGFIKEPGIGGACLSIPFDNGRLKDFDQDGKYEIMYKNNLIGKELQRTLGWIDVDGDGIAELVDPTPYGRNGTFPPPPPPPPSQVLAYITQAFEKLLKDFNNLLEQYRR